MSHHNRVNTPTCTSVPLPCDVLHETSTPTSTNKQSKSIHAVQACVWSSIQSIWSARVPSNSLLTSHLSDILKKDWGCMEKRNFWKLCLSPRELITAQYIISANGVGAACYKYIQHSTLSLWTSVHSHKQGTVSAPKVLFELLISSLCHRAQRLADTAQ